MINMLPDEVLLDIFAFYKEDTRYRVPFTWRWIMLIHICRRWRRVIFGSPRRLDLRLVCSNSTPTRLLDMWPPFPIVVDAVISEITDEESLANIMAALERRDRMTLICLFICDPVNSSALERLMAAMHKPFPDLTGCRLISYNSSSMPALLETFFGGSAPNLEQFDLRGIPFPTFPKLILSSTQIQELILKDIPDSGYISPESMATCLALLPNLRHLIIGSRSPQSRPV
jgi:hypothetical protein